MPEFYAIKNVKKEKELNARILRYKECKKRKIAYMYRGFIRKGARVLGHNIIVVPNLR